MTATRPAARAPRHAGHVGHVGGGAVLAFLIFTACGAPPAPMKPITIAPVASAETLPVASAPIAPHYRETPDEAFRSAAPELALPAPYSPPELKEIRLPNGFRTLLVSRPGSAFLRAELIVRPSDGMIPGAATLVADCLRGGTSKRSEQQVGDDIDDALTQFIGWADGTSMNLMMTSRATDPEGLLELMSDLALHPLMPAGFVERDRIWYVDQRQREIDFPKIVANRVLPMTLFSLARPRDFRTELRASDFREVTQEAVLRGYDTSFVPSRTTLVLIGDVSEASITPKLTRYFGTWPTRPARPQSKVVAPKLAATAAHPHAPASPLGVTSPPRVTLIDRPQSGQSYVLFGGPGPARTSPQFIAAETLEGVIANPGGRVMLRIRDTLNLTWGASTRIDPWGASSLFAWGAEVAAARTGEAMRELDHELLRYHDEDVSESELTNARDRITRGFPADLATTDLIANSIRPIAAFALPKTELSTYIARETAVTAQDLRRVATDMLDPAKTRFVVVGDYTTVRPQLTGFGAIEIRDVNGAFLRVEP